MGNPLGEGARRPPHTDGGEEWPPKNTLPEGWVELPYDDEGEFPARSDGANPWDPFNPKIGAHGRVITLDHVKKLLRVCCGGIVWEVDWDDICQPLPPDKPTPEPPSGCDANTHFTTKVYEVLQKHTYQRETECVVQITCVKKYKLTEQLYVCNRAFVHNTWAALDNPKTQELYAVRTTIFTCPC